MPPGVVVQRFHPGSADREVGLAGPPGAPGGVGDDDRHVAAGGVQHSLAQRTCGGVRVLRQQHHVAGRHVGCVHAGRRHHQAETVLHDRGGATTGDHAHGLLADGRLPVAPTNLPLGLADHLAGHQHHVTVLEVEPAEQGAEVGAPIDLADVLDGPGGQCPRGPRAAHRVRSSAAETRSAVASWSVIHSGTARQRMPAASTRATAASSVVSTSQPSSTPPRERAP